MRIRDTAATIGLAFTLCLLAGCGKNAPECGDPKVLEALKQVVQRDFAVQADQLEQQYYGKMGSPARYFDQGEPIVDFNTNNLSGFASRKKDQGENYCSAVNKGPLAVDLVYKINPQYDGNRRRLLNQVARAFNQSGSQARAKGRDTLLVRVTIDLPEKAEYTAQYTTDGKELNVYYGSD